MMFNEKEKEIIKGKTYNVWKTGKYLESKTKAMELIEKGIIKESDFWILMNKANDTTMAYNGLIISHNGCLKINDNEELMKGYRFDPKYLTMEHKIFNQRDIILFIYNSSEQGIYEIGEVSSANCQNDYPYAMALKRCFDRVVLKISKIAYAGIYSDAEIEPNIENKEEEPLISASTIKAILDLLKDLGKEEKPYREFILNNYKKPLEELTMDEGAKEAAYLAESLKKRKVVKSKEFDI